MQKCQGTNPLAASPEYTHLIHNGKYCSTSGLQFDRIGSNQLSCKQQPTNQSNCIPIVIPPSLVNFIWPHIKYCSHLGVCPNSNLNCIGPLSIDIFLFKIILFSIFVIFNNFHKQHKCNNRLTNNSINNCSFCFLFTPFFLKVFQA